MFYEYTSRALADEMYREIVDEILGNEKIKQLKNFSQHGDISRYDHSINVSYIGYLIAKRFNWDYISIARAGMLHDFFLYDWHKENPNIFSLRKSHAINHGKVALKNAEESFKLSKKEKEMIKKHMWPITIIPPRYAMTYFIGIVDKYCAIMELVVTIKTYKNPVKKEALQKTLE